VTGTRPWPKPLAQIDTPGNWSLGALWRRPSVSRHCRFLRPVFRQPVNFTAVAARGFTLVELLATLAIGALLVVSVSGVTSRALQARDISHEKNELNRQARFAMQRMVAAVRHTRLTVLPSVDNPATNWPENIREQTLPPSPAVGSSSFATAVLAVTLPAYFDSDGNGSADADNDGDGLIDEDLPADSSNDGKPGIAAIDDDGNGVVDDIVAPVADDDESPDSTQNEDSIDGSDDDGDGSIDEDPGADTNGDGCAGICGLDDDGDGTLDEAAVADDDEDGVSDEDWYDMLVFYLDNGNLVERLPVPWDTDGDSLVTGRDWVISTIAENVSRFRVERLPSRDDRLQTVDLLLELTSPATGASVSLRTRVRIGGGL